MSSETLLVRGEDWLQIEGDALSEAVIIQLNSVSMWVYIRSRNVINGGRNITIKENKPVLYLRLFLKAASFFLEGWWLGLLSISSRVKEDLTGGAAVADLTDEIFPLQMIYILQNSGASFDTLLGTSVVALNLWSRKTEGWNHKTLLYVMLCYTEKRKWRLS